MPFLSAVVYTEEISFVAIITTWSRWARNTEDREDSQQNMKSVLICSQEVRKSPCGFFARLPEVINTQEKRRPIVLRVIYRMSETHGMYHSGVVVKVAFRT
jgi:hypothetical protein